MAAVLRGEFAQLCQIREVAGAPAPLGMKCVERTEKTPTLGLAVSRRVGMQRRAKKIGFRFKIADAEEKSMITERYL